MPAPSISAEASATESQHRPQPLAAARNDMAGKLRDQCHRALHALDYQLVDLLQLTTKQAAQRVERGLPTSVHLINTRHQRPQILPPVSRIRQPAARPA